MKKLVLVAIFLLGFAAFATAGDAPAVEIFGGYSYVRVNPPSDAGVDSINLNGWNASLTFNGNKWLGFIADFGGYYGSPSFGGESADVKAYSVMFGPKVSIRKGKITPFVQGLFGFTNLSVAGISENDFSMGFGGGVDINVADKVAIRPVQVEYFGIKEGTSGDFINNFRYSAGIVLKLGKR